MQILEIPRGGAEPASDPPVYERIRALLAAQEAERPGARGARVARRRWERLERRAVDTGALLGTRGALWVACGLAVLFTAFSVFLVVRGGG
jgi:hypothetical protein